MGLGFRGSPHPVMVISRDYKDYIAVSYFPIFPLLQDGGPPKAYMKRA